jgi:hypothetical protein
MRCYICEQTAQPMKLRYDIAMAIGVCHACGIGVCIEHGVKSREPGAPLLCRACAMQRETLMMSMLRIDQKPTRHALTTPQGIVSAWLYGLFSYLPFLVTILMGFGFTSSALDTVNTRTPCSTSAFALSGLSCGAH